MKFDHRTILILLKEWCAIELAWIICAIVSGLLVQAIVNLNEDKIIHGEGNAFSMIIGGLYLIFLIISNGVIFLLHFYQKYKNGKIEIQEK